MTKKYYAVAVGRKIGIYHTWEECEAQVSVAAVENDRIISQKPNSGCLLRP
jgi:hypothetical protein